MFSQHFIECIFHFNSYEKHEKYNRFPQSVRSVEHVCISVLLNDRMSGHAACGCSKALMALIVTYAVGGKQLGQTVLD